MSYDVLSYPEGDPRHCSLCNVRHLEKRIEELARSYELASKRSACYKSVLKTIATSNAACDIEPHKLPVCYNDLVDQAADVLNDDLPKQA